MRVEDLRRSAANFSASQYASICIGKFDLYRSLDDIDDFVDYQRSLAAGVLENECGDLLCAKISGRFQSEPKQGNVLARDSCRAGAFDIVDLTRA